MLLVDFRAHSRCCLWTWSAKVLPFDIVHVPDVWTPALDCQMHLLPANTHQDVIPSCEV